MERVTVCTTLHHTTTFYAAPVATPAVIPTCAFCDSSLRDPTLISMGSRALQGVK